MAKRKRDGRPAAAPKGAPKGKAPKPKKQRKPAPLVSDNSDSDVELDEEDHDIFQEFGERVDFLGSLSAEGLSQPPQETAKRKAPPQARPTVKPTDAAACEDASDDSGSVSPMVTDSEDEGSGSDEAAYERGARSAGVDAADKKPVDLLPFKTAEGALVYDRSRSAQAAQAAAVVPGVSVIDDLLAAPAVAEGASDDGEEDADALGESDAERSAEAHSAAARVSGRRQAAKSKREAQFQQRVASLRDAQAFHNDAQRVEGAKEEIAFAASKLLEAPEENLSQLRFLLELGLDDNVEVSRLALLSLMAIFRDILPGYKIRKLTEQELQVTVTKGVQKMRDFEETLLKAFQAFLKLARSIATSATAPVQHQRVATRCLCGVLDAAPHFNYMADVLQVVVPKLNSPDARTRATAAASMRRLLGGAQHGAVQLEAVQLIADLVRASKCVCHADVARVLLALDFADLSREDVQQGSAALRRRFKFKRRKQRDDAIAAALQEAAARADADETRLQQSLMLEALFELLFRVVKAATTSGRLRAASGATNTLTRALSHAAVCELFPLLDTALEGLGRYTHLISLEYFTDLLDVFLQLLSCAGLPLQLRMRCLLTVEEIMRAQGDSLNVDRRGFYTQLHEALAWAPLAELAADDDAATTPNEQGEGEEMAEVMVAKAAGAMLADLKIGDSARLAAFVKRLTGAALHGNTSTALAMVSVSNRLLRRHHKLRALLEGDSIGALGTGAYNPSAADPSDAHALASTAWELTLLRAHYHPHVAQSAAAVAAIPPGGGAGNLGGVVNTAAGPAQLAESYAYHATGLFRPTPQHRAAPKDAAVAASLRKQGGISVARAAAFEAYSSGEALHPHATGATEQVARRRGGATEASGEPAAAEEVAVAAELQERFRHGGSCGAARELAQLRKRMFAASTYEPPSADSKPGHQRNRKPKHGKGAPAAVSAASEAKQNRPRSSGGAGAKPDAKRKAFSKPRRGAQRER